MQACRGGTISDRHSNISASRCRRGRGVRTVAGRAGAGTKNCDFGSGGRGDAGGATSDQTVPPLKTTLLRSDPRRF